MSQHEEGIENRNQDDRPLQESAPEASESYRQSRRRLLTTLGMGIAGAYVAPTLFSVGQANAQAWDRRYDSSTGATRHRSYQRGKYGRGHSRPSYSRPSYSRPSGYDHRRRERSRIREYTEDPILIIEDAILGPPKR